MTQHMSCDAIIFLGAGSTVAYREWPFGWSCEIVPAIVVGLLWGQYNRPGKIPECHESIPPLDKLADWCQSPQKYRHLVHNFGLLHRQERLRQTRPRVDAVDNLLCKSACLNLNQFLQPDRIRSYFVHLDLRFWPVGYCHEDESLCCCRHVHADHRYSG